MDDGVKQAVREAIIKIIQDTASSKSIQRSIHVHEGKLHFIPAKYRVVGGLIQSLNIKFGNFIEKLIAQIIERDANVYTLPDSGKKIKFWMTSETDALVDQYITSRQLPNSPDRCDDLFDGLIEQIIITENRAVVAKQSIVKDVDALFRLASGQVVYLEIKYNDDHDTGKFVDINRKFIKTYAGLVNHLGITDFSQLRPIVYYFNPTKRWGPIYIPSTSIYRGAQLFDEFFETKFTDIDLYLRNLGDDEFIIEIFDKLYEQIRFGTSRNKLL
jgi:hypothetical protein